MYQNTIIIMFFYKMSRKGSIIIIIDDYECYEYFSFKFFFGILLLFWACWRSSKVSVGDNLFLLSGDP